MQHFLSKQEAIVWRSYRRVPVAKLPYNQRHWVLDRGSLTKRLIHASKGDFKVKISRQSWALPSLDERKLLNLPMGQRAEQQLAHLGERPLGAFLFKSKTMKRGPLQIASFLNKDNKNVSARRSIFFLQNKPILVSEFFMPAVFSCVR